MTSRIPGLCNSLIKGLENDINKEIHQQWTTHTDVFVNTGFQSLLLNCDFTIYSLYKSSLVLSFSVPSWFLSCVPFLCSMFLPCGCTLCVGFPFVYSVFHCSMSSSTYFGNPLEYLTKFVQDIDIFFTSRRVPIRDLWTIHFYILFINIYVFFYLFFLRKGTFRKINQLNPTVLSDY
jgi:hypothetical protein